MSNVYERLANTAGEKPAEQMIQYMDAVLEKNQHINLTAVRDRDEFVLKHLLDSLTCIDSKEWKNAKTIVDIGTGAGFPGVPLAIYSPEKQFTLIDSLAKKLRVIDELTAAQNITNVSTLHKRAEDVGQAPETREHFDVCVSRAVASMNVLVEWCLPLVKKGGTFIAFKGAKAEEELEEAKKAIELLGGKVDRIERAALEDENAEEHVMIYIRKIKNTPKKYPRKAGTARKEPL